MKNLFLFFLILSLFSACMKSEKPAPVKNNYLPETPKLSSDIMTPEVLWSFGRVGGTQVSPDGKSVIFGITYFNIAENKSYRDIYSVPVSGGEARRLTDTPEKEGEEQWRPDGKKIGYISSKSGSDQLWEMNPDGTGNAQVSNVAEGLSGFKYSPDLMNIIYIKSVKLDKDIHDLFSDLPLANARLETDLMYRHWDSWHDYTYQHVVVAKYSETGLSDDKDIMKDERFDSPMKPMGGIEQINWSPDGKTIAYTCKKKVGKEYAISTNSDIYLYNLETGATTNFTEGMMGYDINPVYSPDGQMIAWESMARDGYEADKNRLFIADLKTGMKRDYSAGFDQDVKGLTWTKDSKSIYFISDIHATDEIFRLDLAGEKITRITEGVHDYQDVFVAGSQLVATKVSMSHPAEIYRVDPATGKDEPITTATKGIMDQLTFGKVESRWITTTDKKKMKVWVIYPPHFDQSKKYPALLYCEGGCERAVDGAFRRV